MENFENCSEGIWIVQKHENSKSTKCIKKHADLKGLYPFAQMMEECEELAEYIRLKGYSQIFGSLEFYGDGSIRYNHQSYSQNAEDVIKFLALSKTEKKETLRKIDLENCQWDEKNKKLDYFRSSASPKNRLEEIIFAEKSLKRQLKELKQEKSRLLYQEM